MKLYRNPDAQWREEDDAMEQASRGLETGDDEAAEIGTSIILHSGKMHSLNILGTEIWKLCDGKTVEDIIVELLESFEVEEDVLRQDVNEFLKSMKEEGLIIEK